MNRFRLPIALLPGLALSLLGGCAGTPEQPAPVVVAPVAEVRQPAPAPEPIVLKPDYPERYVVVRGDTLWDIADRFLRDPWRWPELWQKNSYIANPHLIYPGDVLSLIYIDGRPALQVQRADARGGGGETVRMSPQVRIESLERGIPTIPLEAIRPFLMRPRVVSAAELEAAPYILSSADEHLIAATGNKVYVRGIDDTSIANYVVVRKGEAFVNPDDKEDILGYEAIYLAKANVKRFGDPATLVLADSKQEVLNGDRLLPGGDGQIETDFVPVAPAQPVEGKIISLVDGLSQIGQFQIVVVNLGLEDQIKAGHVLAVYQSGKKVRDPVSGDLVTIPDERAGLLMVFRPYDRMSYALVMKSTRPMGVLDRVTNP